MIPNMGVVFTSQGGEIIAYNEVVESLFHSIPSNIRDISAEIGDRDSEIQITKVDLRSPAADNPGLNAYLLHPQDQLPTACCRQEAAPAGMKNLNSEALRQALDMSFDEIFIVDKDGYILFVNKAVERHYGIKTTDFIGKTVFHFADRGIWEPPIFPIVMKEKKMVTVLQDTAVGKKLLVTANPVFNEAGEIVMIVENARDITELEQLKMHLSEAQNRATKYKCQLEELLKKELDLSGFIIHSKKMQEIVQMAQQVAATDSTVLILGETGVGKSLLAKLIHKLSRRSKGPFITLNCAALPEQLFESELFGYSPGAFTGASRTGKIGLIELAEGGTLFLDEIAEIPPRLQAKLLEVIEERQFINIGGKAPKKIDVRIVAATNRDLKKCVASGSFREDLYYRLNVIEITIPPLRERTDEIIPLAEHFLATYNRKYGTSRRLSEDTLDVLLSYSWPGNVRELAHVIERLVITVPEDVIKPQYLPHLTVRTKGEEIDEGELSVTKLMPLDRALEKVERELVTAAFKRLKSSYKVAKALGISQSKAYRLMRKFNCDGE